MTTGQPIKVPSDRNKFNNEFMENLKLQIKLNDQNLQANRLYLSTGQLPPSTQMTDTRSTSEKLLDIEGLKRSIVVDLSPVAETSFAYAIIDGVINSPLNVDNSLFRYLAQNAPQIGQQLSKKYKFGISGDANDVAIIVQFLEDAYNKTRNTFQTIKGYMNSTTNLRNGSTNVQDQIIDEFRYFLQRLLQIEQYWKTNGRLPENVNLSGEYVDFNDRNVIQFYIDDTKSLISEIANIIPTSVQMNQVLNDLSRLVIQGHENIRYPVEEEEEEEQLPGETEWEYYQRLRDNNNNRRRRRSHYESLLELQENVRPMKYNEEIINLVVQMIEKLPNPDTIRTLLSTLEKNLKTGNFNNVRQAHKNIESLFTDWIEPNSDNLTPFQLALREFRSYFLKRANDEIREDARSNRIAQIEQIKSQNMNQESNLKAQRVYVINPRDDPAKVTMYPYDGDNPPDIPPENPSRYPSNILPNNARNPAINPARNPNFLGNPNNIGNQSDPRLNTNPLQYEISNIGSEIGTPSYQSSEKSGKSDPYRISPRFEDPKYSGPNLKFRDIENESVYSFINPFETQSRYSEASFAPLESIYPQEKISLGSESADYPPGYRFETHEPSSEDIYPVSGSSKLPSRYEYLEEERPQKAPNNKRDIRYEDIVLPEFSEKKWQEYLTMKDTFRKAYPDKYTLYSKIIHQYPIQIAHDPEFSEFQLNPVKHPLYRGENPLHRKPPSVLKTGKGVKKGRGISSDYRDFGINKINHKKLNDGILTIRRKSNVNIPDMPSKRISRKLQKIITHISGGGVPDFNEINNLEDNEKDYLHKLISKSNLNDRLSVPAPSKDQEEKDYHQFEVMKGEIMSGNDSKELVKKFKVLILKLSKQNVLPKNEVNELLQDLLSLGY
jgi:hypothetical protein